MVTDGPHVINRHRYLPTPGFGPPGSDARTGRERRPELPEGSIYVGRGTPLGNPFRREKHGEAALDLYLDWLRVQVRKRDPAVMLALRSIRATSFLVCSCSPKPCHADVIAHVWRALRDAGWLVPDVMPVDAPLDADPEAVSTQVRMRLAADLLRSEGTNPDTWQRGALLRLYDERIAKR